MNCNCCRRESVNDVNNKLNITIKDLDNDVVMFDINDKLVSGFRLYKRGEIGGLIYFDSSMMMCCE